ncbi:hypothetical protein PY310_20525 [Pseudarthrobacter sp. H3Y2-7]|nr:hypothetical protein [Pseudarthrobacter sp. H3Y2-7]MDE8670957.1 hypothetical protein [Pseudarthrobacter sp. H3Y2-7]
MQGNSHDDDVRRRRFGGRDGHRAGGDDLHQQSDFVCRLEVAIFTS